MCALMCPLTYINCILDLSGFISTGISYVTAVKIRYFHWKNKSASPNPAEIENRMVLEGLR